MKAGMAVLAAVTMSASLAAQNPPPPRPMGDSAAMMGMMGRGGPGMPGEPSERMRMLRQQVEERFGQMIQTQLSLNEQQMQQLRTAMRANQDRKIALTRRQQDLQRGISGQMAPGVAANADSLNRMLNGSAQIHVEVAQSDQQFQRDLSFLTPVQRARLMMMTRRFEERVRMIRGSMGEPGQGMRQRQPGRGPDGGPQGPPPDGMRQRQPSSERLD